MKRDILRFIAPVVLRAIWKACQHFTVSKLLLFLKEGKCESEYSFYLVLSSTFEVVFIYTANKIHSTVGLPDCALDGECLYFVGLESCIATLFALATNVMGANSLTCEMLNTLLLVQVYRAVYWLSRWKWDLMERLQQ